MLGVVAGSLPTMCALKGPSNLRDDGAKSGSEIADDETPAKKIKSHFAMNIIFNEK